jgi:phospholipid transport system transporter-binding protein
MRSSNVSGNTASDAAVRRDGDALVFTGALTRDAVRALWPRASAEIAGVRRLDLRGVPSVDSAGLALLAELAERAGGVSLEGEPTGLPELRTAYRLDAGLGFASA